MNATVLRALFRDALYQVLDNRVFRLLSILVGVLVLPTWLIGARQDELSLLFGWRTYFYEDVFAWLNLPFPGLGRAHVQLIQMFQTAFVDQFAGKLGITFAVAATAFFVPRMLEKGAADTLFSKPVSRFTLLFSRYMAGLVFIAILATLLVGGMHLGLLVNSGYSDPGFLWTILTLVYLFAILHAFSVAVGVLTRSTVAAILTTLMFFLFTGCTHLVWEGRDKNREEIDKSLAVTNSEAESADTFDRFTRYFLVALDTAHYVLPKTNDAGRIAAKLRRDLGGHEEAVFDPDTRLTVLAQATGMKRRGDFPEEPVSWTPAGGEPGFTARLERRTWNGPESEGGEYRGSNWVRFMVARAAQERRAELASDPSVSDLTEARTRAGIWREGDGWERTRETFAGQSAVFLTWTRADPQRGPRDQRAILFGRWPEFVYAVELDMPAGWADDPEHARRLDGFLGSFAFDSGPDPGNPDAWYSERFDWDAELKYNAFFSILSTLGFVLAVLGLAGWRLSRIDF